MGDWDFESSVGRTPIVRLANVSRTCGCEVFGKLETVNPTGSHKDRESVEILKDAHAKGFEEIGCASTGNAAISLAAFCRMARLKCHIYVSRDIWPEKLTLIETFGPVIHRVSGDYEQAIERSRIELQKTAYIANPGTCRAKIVGNSNIGREIVSALHPGYVVCPTNNGTHLAGVWKGLKESGRRPIMVAAVAEITALADSIQGFHKLEESELNEAVRESGGLIVNVTDDEIRDALLLLLRDGVIAEPSAAAGVAAVRHLKAKPQTRICCTITGSGLKFPRVLARVLSQSTA
jgi:threonine synthase